MVPESNENNGSSFVSENRASLHQQQQQQQQQFDTTHSAELAESSSAKPLHPNDQQTPTTLPQQLSPKQKSSSTGSTTATSQKRSTTTPTTATATATATSTVATSELPSKGAVFDKAPLWFPTSYHSHPNSYAYSATPSSFITTRHSETSPSMYLYPPGFTNNNWYIATDPSQSILLQKSANYPPPDANVFPRYRIGQRVMCQLSDSNAWYVARIKDFGNRRRYFVHYEGWGIEYDEWLGADSGKIRTYDYDLDGEGKYGPAGEEGEQRWRTFVEQYHRDAYLPRTTGLAFHKHMLSHRCTCSSHDDPNEHPERPRRLIAILSALEHNGHLNRCVRLESRLANKSELLRVHLPEHVNMYYYDPERKAVQPRTKTAAAAAAAAAALGMASPTDKAALAEATGTTVRALRSGRSGVNVSSEDTSREESPVEEEAEDAAGGDKSKEKEREAAEDDSAQINGSLSLSLGDAAIGKRPTTVTDEIVARSQIPPENGNRPNTSVPAGRSSPNVLADQGMVLVSPRMSPRTTPALASASASVSKPSSFSSSTSLHPPATRKAASLASANAARPLTPPTGPSSSVSSSSHSSSSIAGSGVSKPSSGGTAEKPAAGPSLTTVIAGRVTRRQMQQAVKEAEMDEAIEEDGVLPSQGQVLVTPASSSSSGSSSLPTGLFEDDDDEDHQGKTLETQLEKMGCGEYGIARDTVYNQLTTPYAACLSAGSLLVLVKEVVERRLKDGFAVIRPPGHHASINSASGFCFFNNVAVAAKNVWDQYKQRTLIVDFDIHHGNGTEKIFYNDPNIMYMSIHRYDDGDFYPKTGALDRCGEGKGLGYNLNVGWSGGVLPAYGDTEYLAAFHHVMMPIARQFNPDLVIISAGFDASVGHDNVGIGGYKVTPSGYASMTRMLKTLCNGRLVMALEGGYAVNDVAECAAACVNVLLQHATHPSAASAIIPSVTHIQPNENAVAALRQVVRYQRGHWKLPAAVVAPGCLFTLPEEWKVKVMPKMKRGRRFNNVTARRRELGLF